MISVWTVLELFINSWLVLYTTRSGNESSEPEELEETMLKSSDEFQLNKTSGTSIIVTGDAV